MILTRGRSRATLGDVLRKALVLAACLVSGCVTVEPHQRGVLSTRLMQLTPDPVEGKLDGHVYEYREGAIGGSGVGGGGCGCN